MKRFAIALAVMIAASAAGLVTGGGGVSPRAVLLPTASPSVVSVHDKHAPNNPPCLKCHPAAARSSWASERLAPTMETCAPCHAAARDATPLSPVSDACRPCHGPLAPGARPVPGTYPRPNVRFSHAAHATAAACADCHPRAAAGWPRGPESDVANMRFCWDCHEKRKGAPTACRTCHIADKDGRLFTDFGAVKLTPPAWLGGPSHGAGWTGGHAARAGADSAFCAACHKDETCRSCHTGARRPAKVHPGDWITAHGVGTRMDNPHCQGCHRRQSFCLTCHRRVGVAPDSPAASRGRNDRGRYHAGMSNEELMRRARRDVTTCVSCHAESSCISCHATVNPHPPGFSKKCRTLSARNPGACAKCHEGRISDLCR